MHYIATMVKRWIADHDERDARSWEAVEEATELLVEGAYERALTALRDVIRADASNPYAYYYVGVGLYELGQLEPARDAFRAAIGLAPSFRGARVGLAQVLRRLGDLQGAIAEGREALRRWPNDGDAMHALGLALAASGDKRAARGLLERYLATNPELESSVEARAALEMMGQADEDDDAPFELS